MDEEQFVQSTAGSLGNKKVTLKEAEDFLNKQDTNKFSALPGSTIEERIKRVSDLGTFQPVSSKINIPGVSNNKPVNQGTASIRDAMNNKQNETAGVVNSATNETEDFLTTINDLTASLERNKTNMSERERAIEEAGKAAFDDFQPLVEDAETKRKRTLPTGVVRAGEAGGFESTQQSGISALLPTDPNKGESFVGAGGKLDVLRQDLDRNITMAKAEQQRAVNAARAAQMRAFDSKDEKDFDRALQLATIANDFKMDQEKLQIQKDNLSLNIIKENRAGVTAQGVADRAERASAIAEANFFTENEDRIAKAIGSQLIGLDSSNEIIQPSAEEIQALADQEGINVDILASAVNERIDALSNIQRQNRQDALAELKFEEVKQQNDLNNQLAAQRNAISGGNLSLSRAKFKQSLIDKQLELLGTSEGFKNKQIEKDFREDLIDFSLEVDSGNIGNPDVALLKLRGLYSQDEVSDEVLNELWAEVNGFTTAGEEDILVGDTQSFDFGIPKAGIGDNSSNVGINKGKSLTEEDRKKLNLRDKIPNTFGAGSAFTEEQKKRLGIK